MQNIEQGSFLHTDCLGSPRRLYLPPPIATTEARLATFPHPFPEDTFFACDFDSPCKSLFLNAKKE